MTTVTTPTTIAAATLALALAACSAAHEAATETSGGTGASGATMSSTGSGKASGAGTTSGAGTGAATTTTTTASSSSGNTTTASSGAGAGGASAGTGGTAGTGGANTPGGPTPAIFSVTDTATLAPAMALSGRVPFAVHLSALEDVPQTCTWTPPGAKAPCNPEGSDTACVPTSKTAAADQEAIWTCIRQRDTDYNSAMSSKYLGGGDLLESRFAWDFGDAKGSYDQVDGFSAAHVYDTPGTYTVSLAVRNGAGATGIVKVPVTVTASERTPIQIDDDASMAQLFKAPPKGSPTREIQLKRGATFHLTGTEAIALASGDWVTSYGDASAAAPVIETNYTSCSGCYIKLFETIGQSHLVVEDVEVRVVSGSNRPFIAEPDGVDVVFRKIVFSDGPGYTGPSRGFTLAGRGMLVEDVGAPNNADGTWASSGLTANFAFMGGQNLSLYGNHVYVDASDSDAEPAVRSCGASVAFVSVVDNQIGGWFGKSNDISIRSGHNVYLGQNDVLWGVFDLQTSCSPGTFSFATSNVVVAENHLENDLFQVNPGVFNVAFRDNVIHRQAVTSGSYPLPVTISVEVAGGDAPWSTDRIEIVGNSFLFEPTVGKLLWLDGGPAISRVDLVNNIFYAPGVGAALQVARPTNTTTPWDLLGTVTGNAFFLSSNESVCSLNNGGTGSGLSIAEWNALSLTGGKPLDALFPASAAGLACLGTPVVDNGVEPIESCRPSKSAPYATTAANLFDPMNGSVDARGVDHDITGAAHPEAGSTGWTPGALQAK